MQLFRNQGTETFQDISSVFAGIPDASRRGAAFGDLNNDGNMDIVVANLDGPPLILLNQGGNHNHRVLIRLMGTKSNKMAIGAIVTVTSGSLSQNNLVQKAEVRAGGSYLSSNDPRLHFGLGTEAIIHEIVISWPSGYREVLHDVPADFIFTVAEGKGIVNRVPLPPPPPH